MTQLFILSLEPIDTRYTGQWYSDVPFIIEEFVKKNNIPEVEVISVPGEFSNITTQATEGAFLNFVDTNIWKNDQISKIASLFRAGEIKAGDKILFPDAWHTGIIQVKYMSELLDIPVEIYSIWHAGSYDPQDFLGRKVKDKKWSYNAERSFFYASDKNFFATKFHYDLFEKEMGFGYREREKAVVCGLPFDYLEEVLKPYCREDKEDLILFPHRIAPEKQVDIFRDLANSMPDYKFIICQEQNLTKQEYHTLLGKSKMVFSANLQETLGISCYEGLLVNSIPFMPNRLSYKEIYDEDYLYPSEWTESFESYLVNKEKLIALMRFTLETSDITHWAWSHSVQKTKCNNFFKSEKMLQSIFKL